MCPDCPKCRNSSADRPKTTRAGSYFRTSDSKRVPRYRCHSCNTTFSSAALFPCYRQKKRHKNEMLRRLLCSGVSQRRAARILRLNRITVVRKFLFLAAQAELKLRAGNLAEKQAQAIEFDDLETFEHTKMKPLSVTLAVEEKTRRILGLRVSRMPANGLLARASRKKYGRRVDERSFGRRRLFEDIAPFIAENALIKSDSNPHYATDVAKYFPGAAYKQFLGKRGSTTGQGELKKVKFDPLFSLNHTCAMFRANVCRLIRKTWCTTKRSDRLQAHLTLYAHYHNQHLA